MIPKRDIVLPPSIRTDFIGGHFRTFRKAPTEFLTTLSKLGDVAYFRMGLQPGYFINDPEMIRHVLVTNARKFVKSRALQRARTLLGDGLLTAEGERHLRNRRMIQPAFHKDRIAEYADAMVESALTTSSHWKDGEVVDIDREMMRLTLRIVGKTLFSADVESDSDRIGASMTTIVELFNFLLLPFSEWLEKLPLPQSRRFRTARDQLNEVVYGIIKDRRQSGVDTGDLISMLLAARDEVDGSPLNDEQIRDEALTLFLAGHETTANALTWTFYLLSKNADVEQKLAQELATVLNGREPNIADLAQLTYTRSVIAESMRLFPPAWAIGRLSIEDHALGGYEVPKGSVVLASPYVTQRDERYWENAEKFEPERWRSIDVKEAGQRFTYFPFGGGVRRCIGESFAWTEEILVLATLAQQWRAELDPGQEIGMQPMITLRPKFGMRMRLSAR